MVGANIFQIIWVIWCMTNSDYMGGGSESIFISVGGCYCIRCVEGEESILSVKLFIFLAKRTLRT